ncbi:response regulator [Rhodoferax lacus]|uniref:Response regulator n=1 Tax=Rhodoferax lacus TaxID=2184758 RepID=A0A3E1RB88_9BURK|nr:response regulator [Rhodoferax lacus]RFO96618.1 response regulator [Rhodoferax lacus]
MSTPSPHNNQTALVVRTSVMVIDDDALTQELLAEILEMLGFSERLSAGDGRSALKLLADMKRPPDVVMCDIFMPEMDGIEFLDQLVGQNYRGGLILMTGVDPEMLQLARTIAEVRGLRVLGTVMKPVSLEQLSSFLTP